MTVHDVLPTSRRLSSKIVGALLTVLVMALIAISATLLLSWQLEGSSAAINETGSLRMHAYRFSLLAERLQHEPNNLAERQNLLQEVKETDALFALLKQGDPQRPLYLPSDATSQSKFEASRQRWNKQIRPLLLELSQQAAPKEAAIWLQIRAQVPLFVAEVEALVQLIEQDSEQRAAWLRNSQLALITLALVGTIALIYLMFLFIIQPINRLQDGMQRMSERDFAVRLPVESEDEFGQVTEGFNEMADKLAELYANLESRVASKTAELEMQNRELAMLYDCARYLQQQQKIEVLCEGFLARIREYFQADGGSVRVLGASHDNLHMIVHHGISKDLIEAEHCLKVGDCLCGEAVGEKITVIHDLRKIDRHHELQCHKEGFAAVSVFQIQTHQQHLGFFNLHFREAKVFLKNEIVLLETLGQMLGVAIENIRLATRERAMAVSEERNLVAQGLHDSIAQGLSFLNIQVQMLEESLAAGNLNDARDIAPQLRAGVQESYEDVRELLQNFRTRLIEGNLVRSLETAAEKFRRQTAIEVNLKADGEGAPLPREHQLQILFIVQEALSNIRKHAGASRVQIELHDHRDMSLTVTDNGVGFDSSPQMEKGENHVGLKIMRERAQRIGAQFSVSSTLGSGTSVKLHLARQQREAA